MNFKIYTFIKLLLGGLVFIVYDYFHISHNLFILIFTAMELAMILSDILLYLKMKTKLSIISIGLYILYNYVGIKILIMGI